MLDPDFGQHLQTGKLILEKGILITDPFSYTMPTWKYIDHAWLSDVLVAVLYPKIGIVGLGLLFAFVGVGALIISGYGKNMISVFFGCAILFGFFGVRFQVLDWLFLAILLRILDDKFWMKWRWFLPVFFCIWANLHSGVAAGAGIVFVSVLVKWWQIKKVDGWDVGVGMFSIFGVVINPYGYELWREILQIGGDGLLTKSIAEWQPWWSTVGFGFWMLAVAIIQLGWKYKMRIPLWKWCVFGVTFLLGLKSIRHMPLFGIVGVSIFGEIINEWDKDMIEDKKVRWNLFKTILLIVAGTLLVIEVGAGTYKSFEMSEDNFYPRKAVEWIKREKAFGQVFTDYGWGSYLIWKLPEKKMFVDGRMPSWRDKDGSAFADFLDISGDKKDFEPVFAKYGVEMVLWPKRHLQKPTISFEVPWGTKKPMIEDLSVRLEKAGWKKVYEDNVAIILTSR